MCIQLAQRKHVAWGVGNEENVFRLHISTHAFGQKISLTLTPKYKKLQVCYNIHNGRVEIIRKKIRSIIEGLKRSPKEMERHTIFIDGKEKQY